MITPAENVEGLNVGKEREREGDTETEKNRDIDPE